MNTTHALNRPAATPCRLAGTRALVLAAALAAVTAMPPGPVHAEPPETDGMTRARLRLDLPTDITWTIRFEDGGPDTATWRHVPKAAGTAALPFRDIEVSVLDRRKSPRPAREFPGWLHGLVSGYDPGVQLVLHGESGHASPYRAVYTLEHGTTGQVVLLGHVREDGDVIHLVTMEFDGTATPDGIDRWRRILETARL